MSQDQNLSRAEFETWNAYDAGGPNLRLRIRFREGVEMPNWQDDPDLPEFFEHAEAEGWRAYDREPGQARDEYIVFHMERDGRADGQLR